MKVNWKYFVLIAVSVLGISLAGGGTDAELESDSTEKERQLGTV